MSIDTDFFVMNDINTNYVTLKDEIREFKLCMDIRPTSGNFTKKY